MSDIIAVKDELRNTLFTDPSVAELVSDRVYLEWIARTAVFPCLSIVEAVDQAEVSGLGDSYDGVYRYQWHNAVVQVDCWSNKSADERDKLETTVRKCLLKNAVNQVFCVQEPAVAVLDELDVKPPLWRASLRFKVMFATEA